MEMIRPPFTQSTIFPSTISPDSYFATISCQFCSESTFNLSRVAMPSISLILITFARTSSPILNISSSFADGSSVSLSCTITPVVFVPRSSVISFWDTDVTTPTTISPGFNVFMVCSSISAKFSICSLIVCLTSCITLNGVEAPAVIDMMLQRGGTTKSPIESAFSHR